MRLFALLLFICSYFIEIFADKPCAARAIPGQSVVCVCNSTYCDEINKEDPTQDTIVYYATSNAGFRLQKIVGSWGSNEQDADVTLTLNPDTTYQTIEGFGGSVTDSAGINWKSLPQEQQDYLISSYFSEQGLEYNMLRVPIGGCDFSTRPYAYNDLPVNDFKLSNFTLAPEDFSYKIPMIKKILAESKSDIHSVATTWSPPPWMKTNNNYTGISRLRPECYQTYADYHVKFLEEYIKSGIPFWGITTTNEPTNGDLNLIKFNSLGWTVGPLGDWIANNFGPTIRNSTFKDIKIMTGDDQRLYLPLWANALFVEHPEALKYVDGFAVHWYFDRISPTLLLDEVNLAHPDKFMLATEACAGSLPTEYPKVIPGSWDRAVKYAQDIMEDLNHSLTGWIDWNLCLDMNGGPNWANNFADAAVLVDIKNGEFLKQPTFYIMGHFSKFVPRGSMRIDANQSFSLLSNLDYVAFLTPKNTVVTVIYNSHSARTVNIKYGNKQGIVNLPEQSVVTVVSPYST